MQYFIEIVCLYIYSKWDYPPSGFLILEQCKLIQNGLKWHYINIFYLFHCSTRFLVKMDIFEAAVCTLWQDYHWFSCLLESGCDPSWEEKGMILPSAQTRYHVSKPRMDAGRTDMVVTGLNSGAPKLGTDEATEKELFMWWWKKKKECINCE